MDKKIKVTTCVWCPHYYPIDGKDSCSKKDYKEIKREDIFELEKDTNNALVAKTPDWCPLEDY